MKKMLFFILLGVTTMNADWLDELVKIAPTNLSDVAVLTTVIDKYIAQDTQRIAKLEKTIQENEDSGFWATLRGGTLQAELATTKTQRGYHQKVAKYLKELPENKKERERLISNLQALQKNQEELAVLKESYAKADDLADKIKKGAQVAAKEVELNGRKTVIKGLFLF